MSCFRLRSYEQSPPGGYCFEEPGFKRRCFPVIEDLARAISQSRAANGRPRSSIQDSLRDADTYQCQRLGNNPTYCITCSGSPNQAQPVAMAANAPLIAPPCQGCGTVVQ